MGELGERWAAVRWCLSREEEGRGGEGTTYLPQVAGEEEGGGSRIQVVGWRWKGKEVLEGWMELRACRGGLL